MNKHYSQSDEPTLPADRVPYYSSWQNAGGRGQPAPLRPYQFPEPAAQQPVYLPRQPDYPQRPVYPATQPAWGPVGRPGDKKPRGPRKKRGCMIGCLSSLVIGVILFIF